MSSQPAKSRTSRWSRRVTEHSDALDLEARVFKGTPAAIARSLKRSADRSRRRKSSPFRSAMSMLTFYKNRAGKQLSAARKRALDRAKDELRRLYKRPAR
jgi:hypothetical protein